MFITVISIVNMLTFLLPPSSGEKVLLGAINFFILSMFLLYFQAKLPPLGDHLPLLGNHRICKPLELGFLLNKLKNVLLLI